MSIETLSLSRSLGGVAALKDCTLSVEPGEISAIVGLNGAGKTTLMRLLLAMLAPESGSRRILGDDVAHAGPDLWSRVGYLVNVPFAYLQLTVRENLFAAGLLHGMSGTHLTRSIDYWVERVNLGYWADRRARTLSSGNRQRLGIAASMMHRPMAVILDEPATALDPAGVVETRLIFAEAAAWGAAVMVSSHHLDELARTADTITIMHRGTLVGGLEPQSVDLERQFFETVHRVDLEQSA